MTSYPQFGQIQSLAAPQLLNSTVTVSKPGSTSPLENSSGSPDHPHHQPSTAGMTANPLTAAAQSPYSAAGATMAASYNPALFSYTRLPGLSGESMYGSAAAALAPTQGLYSLGTDPAAFYVNPLTGTPYDLKDNAEIWRNLSQSAATCFPYDPTGFGAYGYGYGGMDLSLAARRKNATKENTSTLKAWLNEHKKNPYPTKGEKIMLAIITKMTLTQVSTWFANARRRLKKDNKMTWSPRTKGEDSDDEHAEEGNKSGDDMDSNEHGTLNHNANSGDKDGDDEGNHVDVTSCDSDEEDGVDPLREPRGFMPHPGMPSQSNTSSRLNNSHNKSNSVDNSPCTSPSGPSSRSPITQSDTPPRPRIWSLADVLGPSTGPSTSGSTLSSDTRTYMGASSGAGLSFPMPLKPTVSTPNGLGYSPTAASLRHWAERSPYSIPGAAALSASPFAAGVGTRPSLPLGTTGGLPGGALTQNSQATGLSVTVSATDALRAHAHTIDKPAELGGHSPADPLPLTAFRPVPRR